MNNKDTTILRELAKQYMDVCADPVQAERRMLWRKHNSLISTRPLIYVRAFAWSEMPQSQCVCEDPFFQRYEGFFRKHLFWDSLGDDSIFEPWVIVQATRVCRGWGVSGERNFSDEPGGAFKVDYPIKDLSDIENLRIPWHEIDEANTAKESQRLSDAIGDIITVDVDRGPAFRM